jgi:hypothetical protein
MHPVRQIRGAPLGDPEEFTSFTTCQFDLSDDFSQTMPYRPFLGNIPVLGLTRYRR